MPPKNDSGLPRPPAPEPAHPSQLNDGRRDVSRRVDRHPDPTAADWLRLAGISACGAAAVAGFHGADTLARALFAAGVPSLLAVVYVDRLHAPPPSVEPRPEQKPPSAVEDTHDAGLEEPDEHHDGGLDEPVMSMWRVADACDDDDDWDDCDG